MRRIYISFVLLFILIALLFPVGCGSKEKSSSDNSRPEILRVGLIPNQSPDKVKAQYEPFRKYLEEKLTMPVELFVATDYSGVVEAMAADKLDLAYLGGLTYVQARQIADIYPIVTEIDPYSDTTKYHSLIIVPATSPASSLKELKGKVFAFGDINSTSGSLYPRLMLEKAGLKVPDDFARVIYTGGHDATAQAVQNGTVDAGGIEDRILYRLEEKGAVDPQKIKIIAKSDPIEGYPWVVRANLDKKLVDKITRAFLEITDPQLLDLMRAVKYVPISAEDYDFVEREARRLGLIKFQKK
ncbi:MAG: phosphate/phosphite/phosphonate ABC transporter substrate-binding protein [Bacillota bacterium]